MVSEEHVVRFNNTKKEDHVLPGCSPSTNFHKPPRTVSTVHDQRAESPKNKVSYDIREYKDWIFILNYLEHQNTHTTRDLTARKGWCHCKIQFKIRYDCDYLYPAQRGKGSFTCENEEGLDRYLWGLLDVLLAGPYCA